MIWIPQTTSLLAATVLRLPLLVADKIYIPTGHLRLPRRSSARRPKTARTTQRARREYQKQKSGKMRLAYAIFVSEHRPPRPPPCKLAGTDRDCRARTRLGRRRRLLWRVEEVAIGIQRIRLRCEWDMDVDDVSCTHFHIAAVS